MAKILLVDDAAFMRAMLRQILEKLGHEIVGEAVNGIEAVQQYNKLKPELVTMDITMPEMDGIEAVKKICSQDKNAKIIMVSAMGQEGLVKQSIIYGAKDFVIKPFQSDRVQNSIDKVLA